MYEFTKEKIFGKLVNFLINLLKFFFFFDIVGEIYFNFSVIVVYVERKRIKRMEVFRRFLI